MLTQVKKVSFASLLVLTLSFTSLSTSSFAATNGQEKAKEHPGQLSKKELLDEGVKPAKVDDLVDKMNKGKKLDSDIYVEKIAKEENGATLATSDDPHFRKDFNDGSFIESTIEDVTDEVVVTDPNQSEGSFQTLGVTQTGGTQENRTLKVSQTAPWGSESFYVKVYFPLKGNSKILQAYNWYYIGAVSGVDYRGIYRANETASQAAVAMQKLQIGIKGLSYIAKLEFRMKGGSYYSTYSS
ncbi:hypothetical protein P5663_20800 (plasmid) [Priestia flexa]|uniref:hypothetical protein n=1 Tax=Priestia flexa TaxID=86664 RepID=UPI00240D10ED|nr:hypothetical protein [Priestia flexa]WEZ10351.1 hypothetical protein P5663_20800 [Priestia flexa]